MKLFNKLCLTAVFGLAVTSNALAASKTIRFLHINDLHAHLVPHQDRIADGNGGTTIEERGGFARLATLLKQQRAENPNNITMNIGDTFHGGVEALYSMGNAIVAPVNALNIDVGVAGNWDFAYSPGLTRMRFGPVDVWGLMDKFNPLGIINQVKPNIIDINKLPGLDVMNADAFKLGFQGEYITDDNILSRIMPIQRPNYLTLGANIKDIFVRWDFMPATYSKVVDGVKVGFIGLTSDIIKDMHILMGLGFDITKGEDNYRKLINKHAAELRANGAEIVVVMSELGIHKDNRLAQIIDKGAVDVFFSAHTHEAVFEPLTSDSGALVVEAGNDGWLGQMDITVDDVEGITATEWKLLPIDSSLADDPEMQALVDAARAPYLQSDVNMIAPPFMMQKLKQPIDTVIGRTDHTVDRKDALHSTFNAGWTDMIREMTGADVAITPGFRMDTTFVEPGYLLEDNTVANGDISLEDAYRLFPVVYLMAVGEIDGAGMRNVLEDQLTSVYSTDVFKHAGGWTYGISGLDIELDLAANDGVRISSLKYSDTGETVGDDDLLKVGGCWRTIDTPRRLCSLKGFSKTHPILNPDDGQPLWTALDAFVYALKANNFNGTHVSITDSNATPGWPDDDFIQPLEGALATTGNTGSQSNSNAEENSEDSTPFLAATGPLQILVLASMLLLIRRRAKH